MIDRKPVVASWPALIAAALMISMLVGTADAAEQMPWNQATFAADQDAGKSIIVYVTAPWCPTCAAQKPTVTELESDPRFAHAVVFTVDFDSQKDVLRQFHVSMQSTLIAFKGKTEQDRATGLTDPDKIRALFARSL